MGYVPNDPYRYYDMGVSLPGDPRVPVIPDPVPDWAKDQIGPGPDPTTPQSEQKSARYQDDIQFRRVLPRDNGPQWYPLAAFHVGPGEIGFIYDIGTQINGYEGEESRIWYRNADPFSFLLEVPGMSTRAAPRWRLALQTRSYDRTFPRRMETIEPGPLQVHPDLSQWWDGRFVYNAGNYRVKLMVPEGTTARLWVCMPVPQIQEQSMPNWVSGRLIGFTQSWADNSEARYNARRAW